jgi:hypothetical protein
MQAVLLACSNTYISINKLRTAKGAADESKGCEGTHGCKSLLPATKLWRTLDEGFVCNLKSEK